MSGDDDGRAAVGGEARQHLDDLGARCRCRGCRSARRRGSPAARRRARARSRPAAARRPRGATAGGWRGRRGRPRRAAPRRARASSTLEKPAGASFAWTFSSAVRVGIRLNCWKTKPKERSRSSARSPSRSSARSRPSKKTRAARGPVERAEELEQCRLAGAARPFERDELARLDASGRRPASALITSSAADERLADAAELVLAHSTVLRASAGRRRAARKAPAAPASRPPTRASAEAGEQNRDADRRRRARPPRSRCARPARRRRCRPPPVVELAVSVGPKTPTRSATPTPSTTPTTPPSNALGERLARDLPHDPALRPAERLQRPELPHALADGGEREQRGEQERRDRRDDARARGPRLCERFGGVDERAADRAGDAPSRSRPRACGVRRLGCASRRRRRRRCRRRGRARRSRGSSGPRASGAARAAGRRRRPGLRAAG